MEIQGNEGVQKSWAGDPSPGASPGGIHFILLPFDLSAALFLTLTWEDRKVFIKRSIWEVIHIFSNTWSLSNPNKPHCYCHNTHLSTIIKTMPYHMRRRMF